MNDYVPGYSLVAKKRRWIPEWFWRMWCANGKTSEEMSRTSLWFQRRILTKRCNPWPPLSDGHFQEEP